MEKIEVLKKELDKLKAFEPTTNSVVMKMISTLGDEVPYRMSVVLANYTMASFVGHFHWKIELEVNNLVPVNVISFVLAKSGAKKTSSVKKLRSCLDLGYDLIEAKRQLAENELAISLEVKPRPLKPLINALSTQEGIIRILNEFSREGLGLPSLFVDEITTELDTSSDIIPNIKLVSQLFDDGDTESKALKDVNNQSEEVRGMGMNALFMGSEIGILENEVILKKFNMEFMSKLGRRCYFVYPDEETKETNNKNIDDILGDLDKSRKLGRKISEELGRLSISIAKKGIDGTTNRIGLSVKGKRLIDSYMLYNKERSELEEIEVIKLEQSHREWKVLKLAGVYTIFKGKSEIGTKEIREAITVAELLSKDLQKFIYKAERQIFEKVADHFINGRKSIKVHEMVKKKWIKDQKDIDQLLLLVNSRLEDFGTVYTKDNMIVMDKFEKLEGVQLTYKKATGTKEQRSRKVTNGYKTFRKDFSFMSKVISNDTAYTNVRFKDGVRGKSNVEGNPDFLILDVDDTDISDKECSSYLMDFNHMICRTSNKKNPYKYRILLPTDVSITVDNEDWSTFLKKVAEDLGIEFDILPKAQIFYGYKDREVIHFTEGEDYPIKRMMHSVSQTKHVPKKKFSKAQLEGIYEERFVVFKWFYEEEMWGKGGQYHNSLFLFTRNAAEKGVDLESSKAILDDIVDYRTRDPRDGYINALKDRMEKYPEYNKQEKEY